MMSCCRHCEGVEEVFSRGIARSDLESYRKKGPSRQTRMLLAAIRAAGIEGRRLLDVGGGVGVIQHELFTDGLHSATQVDASSAYLAASREEAARRGHAERVTYIHGNFVDMADTVEEADWVTLDRVICCYPDMPALVRQSAARARQFYGLVYPRDSWWARLGVKLMNLGFRIQRNPFRVFVHPSAEVDSVAAAAGLRLQSRRKAGLWQVVIYARPGLAATVPNSHPL